jgi:hypothetical protein
VSAAPHLVVGWREWIALPQLKLRAVRSKIDTGARSSALHVSTLERTVHDGVPWVRFGLKLKRHRERLHHCEAEIVDEREVTDSGGHKTLRPFIRTIVGLGRHHFLAEINLTNRSQLLFPMLLGRTALAGHALVDPSASFLLGGGERNADDLFQLER